MIAEYVPGRSDSERSPAASAAAEIGSRIDRLPTTRSLGMLVTVLSCGAFFEVYDLLLTGDIAPGMVKSGLLSSTTTHFFGLQGIGGFIAVFFAGLFIGTAGLGRLGDRFGRRAVFTYALLTYSVASAVMAFQTSFEGLFFWRFLSSMGVGFEIITITAYVTELLPHRMRGKAIAYCFALGFTAAPVCGMLSHWLVPQTLAGLDGWRWVVLIGLTVAVLVWFIRLGLSEAPRWLAERGEITRSEVVRSRIEARVARDYVRPLPLPDAVTTVVPVKAGFVVALSRSLYRARVLMLLVFNFFQAIGYYGFGNWLPTLLIGQGIKVTKSLLYSTLIAIALPVSCIIAMGLVERVERKRLIVGGALAVVACGVLFSRTTDSLELKVERGFQQQGLRSAC